MGTTEEYLDQLLRSASDVGTVDTGESDLELQNEEGIIPLESSIEEEQPLEGTMEMPVEDGLSLEQAMEMSVNDILTGMESSIEVEPETEIPEDTDNGMMSEEAIAAMFAASEEAEAVKDVEELIPLEDDIESGEETAEISLDDMLADMREETSETTAEDFPAAAEELEAESETGDEGNDSILDLLNMMSEDEDLKDIGDLLKSDEDSYLDISDDELFGEPPAEEEEIQPDLEEPEEKEKSQGLFGKLFGKKKAGEDKKEGDENEQIIKEVEQEIKQEDIKAEKKDKNAKKKKNAKVKEGQEEEEGTEAKSGKKKKEKKKKEKKVKPPKEKEILPKEPPFPKKPVILIMLMAVSILALVLLSHSVMDYQFSISRADSSFINRNYEEAYENILGVDVKEEDKQLYDRIRVMMKLEAKYKMYLSHIEQNKYDEALNDLIMGVIKYDQYKKDAEELGISQAFDDELALLEEQLNVVFGVDADQARDWYNTLSALDYTEMVRNVVKAAGYTVEESEIENTEGTSNDLSQFGVEEVE